MPYCPRCRCEYNVGVVECIDCHVPLVAFRPWRRGLFDIDFDELLVPAGALFTLISAAGLYGISTLAQQGQIAEPLGPLIASQPPCLTGFYIVSAILSALILVITLLRWLVFRR